MTIITSAISGKGSALTSTAESPSHVTITIPAEKGGRCTGIEIYAWGTLETVVNTGGLVKFKNDSCNWEPLEVYLGPETCVTSGGIAMNPYFLAVNKPLPAKSIVTVSYTPQDNQSQYLSVVLHYVRNESASGPQTYAKSVVGSAVTATARVEAGSGITIPGGKDGQAVAIELHAFGTLTTVVNTGGKFEIESDSHSEIKPQEFYAGKMTCVTAGGVALSEKPYRAPVSWPVASSDTIHVFYSPIDTQSQKAAAVLIWES
jgi:hypothetical protein